MKLDAKQKILLPIIVFAFVFIGWQVYDMVGGSSNKSVASVVTSMNNEQNGATASETVLSSMDVARSNLATPEISAKKSPIVQDQDARPQSSQLSSVPAKPQQGAVKDIEGASFTDDTLMREYQELKKEEMLLNEKLAIAQTRQKIAELNSKIASLGGVVGVSSLPSLDNDKSAPHRLVYIDYQGDKWAATLSDSAGNNLKEVVAGSKLSDGTTILSINAKGVVAKKNGNKMLLTFSGVVPLGKVVLDEQTTSEADKVTIMPQETSIELQNEKAKINKKAVKLSKKINKTRSAKYPEVMRLVASSDPQMSQTAEPEAIVQTKVTSPVSQKSQFIKPEIVPVAQLKAVSPATATTQATQLTTAKPEVVVNPNSDNKSVIQTKAVIPVSQKSQFIKPEIAPVAQLKAVSPATATAQVTQLTAKPEVVNPNSDNKPVIKIKAVIPVSQKSQFIKPEIAPVAQLKAVSPATATAQVTQLTAKPEVVNPNSDNKPVIKIKAVTPVSQKSQFIKPEIAPVAQLKAVSPATATTTQVAQLTAKSEVVNPNSDNKSVIKIKAVTPVSQTPQPIKPETVNVNGNKKQTIQQVIGEKLDEPKVTATVPRVMQLIAESEKNGEIQATAQKTIVTKKHLIAAKSGKISKKETTSSAALAKKTTPQLIMTETSVSVPTVTEIKQATPKLIATETNSNGSMVPVVQPVAIERTSPSQLITSKTSASNSAVVTKQVAPQLITTETNADNGSIKKIAPIEKPSKSKKIIHKEVIYRGKEQVIDLSPKAQLSEADNDEQSVVLSPEKFN
jgi:hypothetical protein